MNTLCSWQYLMMMQTGLPCLQIFLSPKNCLSCSPKEHVWKQQTVQRRHALVLLCCLLHLCVPNKYPRELEMFAQRRECHSEMILHPGYLCSATQCASSWGRGRHSAGSSLRAPPTASRSFTFYLQCRAARFISEGGWQGIRCNPDFCSFSGDKKEREREKPTEGSRGQTAR